MGRPPSKKRRAGKGPGRRGESKKKTKKVTAKRAKRAPDKSAAKPARRRASGATVAEAKIARLSRELSEALARQTATSEVLQVISSSPGDLKPVFDQMLAKAMNLCEAQCGFIYQMEQGAMRAVAEIGVPPAFAEYRRHHLHTGGATTPADIMRATKRPAHVHDARDSDAYRQGNPNAVAGVELGGARTVLYVPMIRNDDIVGVINLYRLEVKPFTDEQIALLENFASQAVIAIENTQLFNETREALARQTATADILKVIAGSPDDVQPVFDAIAQSARRVIGGHSALVTRVIGEHLHIAAFTAGSEVGREKLSTTYPQPLSSSPVMSAQVVRTGQIVSYADTERDADDLTREFARVRGYRSVLAVPMLRDGIVIGTVNVTRVEPGEFDDNTISLLKTFADQAVIAIENVRLFNETKEALARQTATSEVLSVISNSVADTAPVFEKILDSCEKLFATEQLGIFVVQPDGQTHVGAWRGSAVEAVIKTLPRPVEETATGVVIRNRAVLHVPKTATAQDLPLTVRGLNARIGDVSIAWAPMLTEEAGIGSIAVMRQPPNPFSEKELALLKTFADQAVIAIQNTRLFNETREALARQTATADVLKVIASSPSNLQPVFDAIAERSRALIGGHSTVVVRLVDGVMELAAFTSVNPEADAALKALFPRAATDPQINQVRHGEIAQIIDAESELQGNLMLDAARARGWRSRILVPLKDDTGVIGWISITRREAGVFAEKDAELLQTFADQAVIAIKNVELFEEVQARTRELMESLEQQTATSEVLEVISSSVGELEPVFQKMLENATRICGANFGTMSLYEAGSYQNVALYNVPASSTERLLAPIRPHPNSGLATVARTLQAVQIEDLRTQPPYLEGHPAAVAISDLAGARTLVIVPMLRENELIGTIAIYRQEVRRFTDKQVELVANFAKQAVIAIENTRLLSELRERTRELSQSLDDLRAAQDRLVQTEKLASLGQLTAGIAHEIKNPPNFVNNFSALSVELTDELNDVLKQAELAEKIELEVGELTQLLKSNLEKVVQHGKRADSIVKNMLLHSREGSGEQRAADVNALVEESLNLAYHGARAEKSGFNITLQRKFDAGAGAADLFPQEITRALLNLISNGFYAATRRKAEHGEATFEPTLLATTKDLGSSVEIRIRDNGAGIPPDVKEKMFNPFFTTKPAGEGTGLGLSMTHDIIVKQHGGTIDVATEPGNFTEFILVLPRANGAHGKSRGPA